MKEQLRELLLQAIRTLQNEATLPADLEVPHFVIERTRSRDHGVFAANAAMLLAKAARAKPRELAEKLVAALPANGLVGKVEIAGPGFINFFLAPGAYHAEVGQVLAITDLDNSASQRVAARLGMTDEGVTERWFGLTARQYRKVISFPEA